MALLYNIDMPVGPPSGPLAGIRVIDASTILAGPLACQILGDFGADVVKIEHPTKADGMRGHGPAKDGVPLWWKEISRNKRTIGLSLSEPDGAALFLRLAADADVVVENFRPGTLERWGVGPAELHAVNPGLVIAAGHRLRPDRPVRRPGRLRHAGRGDERLRAPHRAGRRSADAAGVRPRRLDRRHRGLVRGVHGAARPREGPGRASGQVIDLNLLEPIMTAVGPGPDRLPADRRGRDPARQPVDQQRAAQRLRDLRRPLGRDLDQRPEHRRAGHAPGRPPRGHRRAVVRRRLDPGRARRRARRDGRRLDRRAHPGRGAGGVRRGRRRGGPDLQRPGPRRGPARAGYRHAPGGGRRRPGPDGAARRDVADVRDARLHPVHRSRARPGHRRGARRGSACPTPTSSPTCASEE